MQDKSFSLVPTSLTEAKEFATLISQSDMVPKDYKDKPSNVLVAIQMGMELGLPPMQALQNIAVINGRPAVWGDAMLALVRSNASCEWVKETIAGEGDKMVATCAVQRKGDPEPTSRSFSVEDAKKAGLWSKDGPWKNYPKRMLQMRARSWACRDAFPDALRGIGMVEEVQDTPKNMGDAEVVERKTVQQPQPIKTYEQPVEGVRVDPMETEPVPERQEEQPRNETITVPGSQEGTPIVPGAIRIVTMKLEAAGKTEADLMADFGVDKVEALRQSQVNGVLAWLKS
jgi:RecT family